MAKKPSKRQKPAARKRSGAKPRRQKEEVRPASLVLKAEPVLATRNDSLGFVLAVGFLLVVAGVLFLPNFRILLAGSYLDCYKFIPYAGMIAGFAMLFWAFRRPWPVPPLPELSRPMACFLFVFFYSLCFYTRFSHPETPQVTFWFDDLVVYGDIRAILDFGENHLLFPWGQREPFFPYLTAFIWKWMPQADGVFVDRLSSTLIDMGTCWGFYRLGRALSGRWMGFFLMAMYSVGKPMVIECFFGYGGNSCVLSTVWMAYFFFHLVQKPVFRRFLYLGIALGFGAFTYVPARPWPPFLIGVVWLWVLWMTRSKAKDFFLWLLLMGGMGAWAFLAVFKNGYLPETLSWVAFLTSRPVYETAGLIFLALYLYAGFRTKKDENTRLVFGWATMAALALLLTMPFYLQREYGAHIVESSAFHADGKLILGMAALAKVLDRLHFYFTLMFVQPIYDSSTYPIPYDSFFDPLPVIAMVTGLAFFAAKPSWRKGLVLALIALGMIPFVFAERPHAGRAMASVVPLLVLGAWGMDYLGRAFFAAVPDRLYRNLTLLGLAAFWVWNATMSDWSIWKRWMADKAHDSFIFQQIEKDWRSYRVIVARNDKFADLAITALCDQREVYQLDDPNPLYLEEGERGKDVDLLFWGYDKTMEDRVKKDYPEAQIGFVPGYHVEDPNFLERAIIPFDSIARSNGKLFSVVRVPHGYWRRRFYCENYGWARGLVWWDERVPGLVSPLPPKDVTNYMTARADGEFNASVEGDYEFSGTNIMDFVILRVDGKKIMHYYPYMGGKNYIPRGVVHLLPGSHSVSLETYFKYSIQFPGITVKPPVGPPFLLGQ